MEPRLTELGAGRKRVLQKVFWGFPRKDQMSLVGAPGQA